MGEEIILPRTGRSFREVGTLAGGRREPQLWEELAEWERVDAADSLTRDTEHALLEMAIASSHIQSWWRTVPN